VNRGARRTLLALALQLAALAVLGLAVRGASWLDARSKPRVLVLIDRSHSMPRADTDKALAEVVRAARAAGVGEVQWLEFAGRPAQAAVAQAGDTDALQPATTDIEAALDAALAAHAQAALDSVVVVSDGLENRGDAARALRAMREAGLPLQWMALGRPPPPARIVEVLAPDRALPGQSLHITVQLAGQVERPLRVKATLRSAGGDSSTASTVTAGAERVTLALDARRAGAAVVDVALEDAASGVTLDTLADAAVIDLAPPAAVLYVRGSSRPAPLARSLIDGGWALKEIPALQLEAQADALDAYQAVVFDDVAVTDASPRLWTALVAAVRDRGTGLMVLGGERSFARGGYRASSLESVLPVLSEPAALDQPVSVVFAVDKSGSMGRGSGGVDRFALARRAVLETARSLTERDALGLVVFDVVPRVLVPLGPAADGALALARDWRAQPQGGTKLAPALELAITELEGARAARRLLVIVTDGFVDSAPLAGLRARLDRARIETIALAVGPDADVGALERLVGASLGQVLRVEQAAELPFVMRAGLERQRSRVERGRIAVVQTLALPFSPAMLPGWPGVAAHAVTRSRPEALVAVQSERGEPLIAWQQSGRGRVLVVTCGLGPWAPQWLRWRAWPQLAGGLVSWVSGTPAGRSVGLTVTDLRAGLQVDADIATVAGGPGPGEVAITVNTPTTTGQVLAMDRVAPGRLRATLPDAGAGLYTFLIATAQGSQRQLHLRRQRAESGAWGVNPALQAWRRDGLAGDWQPGLLARRRDDGGKRALDRTLIAGALVLFLAGVLLDRATLKRATVSAALRRWRIRASEPQPGS